MAAEAIGIKALEDMIPGMQPDDCRIAVAALRAGQVERVPFADCMQGEYLFCKSSMKQQFTQIGADIIKNVDDLDLDDEQIKEALKQWQPAHSWAALDRFFEGVTEQAQKPYWDRQAVPKPGDPLVDLLVPVYGRTAFNFALADARLRLALVHLAAQGYMLAEGIPPTDLEALVPDYLPMIPDDPFADGTIRLALRGDDFVIYSVGPDGVDDGGRAIEGIPEPDATGDIAVTL